MPILVAGEALIDVVTATDGAPVAHVGGSPLNVAVDVWGQSREQWLARRGR